MVRWHTELHERARSDCAGLRPAWPDWTSRRPRFSTGPTLRYDRSFAWIDGHDVNVSRHTVADLLILLLPLAALGLMPVTQIVAEETRYNRDVRPILADNCFRCHGPDEAARQAGLRLDQREAATADRNGLRVIAPGRTAESELIRRITSGDRAERMPPPDSGLELSESDITTLRSWINGGADYQSHWSFISPKRPPPPVVSDLSWPKNPVDRFVLSKLDREGASRLHG